MDSYQGRFFHFALVALLALVCGAAAGCGSSSSSGGSTAGRSTPVSSTPSTTTPPTSSGTTTSGGSASSATNLVATATVKSQLLAAGAKMHHLPVSDYSGLVKGITYYAYDPSTKTHWAGAGLIAKPGATQAQVGDQDDGAYLVYKQPTGAAWHAYPAGIPGSTQFTCMVTPPAAVDALWGWPAGTCHPPHG